MKKIDFKKELKHLYTASAEPKEVDVPEMNYLKIDGFGDPNKPDIFQDRVEALYSLAFSVKFSIKNGGQPVDFGVMPLEGLWWTDKMEEFSIDDKSNWKWTLMIMQPAFIDMQIIENSREAVFRKKKSEFINQIRFEKYSEGLSAQLLHIGPYSTEGDNIKKLHDFIKQANGRYDGLSGKHHEIYLSDARKTAPEKLKTIIRQPFRY